MLHLNTIRAQPGATRNKKRLGRGQGSGHGATAGKGDKGQLARSGGHSRPGFEGGQMPLYRRIPKRGFKNPCRRTIAVLNVRDLEKLDSKLKEVSIKALQEAGILRGKFDRLAILADGELTRAFSVKAHRVSEPARAKIEKAGGKVEMVPIPGPQPRVLKKNKQAKQAKAKA